MKIIEELKKKVLNEQIYKRKDVDGVKQAINRLQVEVPNSFIEFYMEFEGPFWEETFGLELLDIIEERDNIENLTCICREEYLFPK